MLVETRRDGLSPTETWEEHEVRLDLAAEPHVAVAAAAPLKDLRAAVAWLRDEPRYLGDFHEPEIVSPDTNALIGEPRSPMRRALVNLWAEAHEVGSRAGSRFRQRDIVEMVLGATGLEYRLQVFVGLHRTDDLWVVGSGTARLVQGVLHVRETTEEEDALLFRACREQGVSYYRREGEWWRCRQ